MTGNDGMNTAYVLTLCAAILRIAEGHAHTVCTRERLLRSKAERGSLSQCCDGFSLAVQIALLCNFLSDEQEARGTLILDSPERGSLPSLPSYLCLFCCYGIGLPPFCI